MDLDGAPLRPDEYEILLLVNNSSDNSMALAEHYVQCHPRTRLQVICREFGPEQAHIGHVRRLLMDQASLRLQSVGRRDGLILSTDADSEVEPDWIARNRQAIDAGAQAVGGRILLRPSEFRQLNERTREIQLLDDRYGLLLSRLEDHCDPLPHDRWPRHHQHFGGSLAVTASTYESVGGLPPIDTLEDVAFYESLVRKDVRFRHSPLVRVRTSSRLSGRTQIGLAEQLTRWAEGGRSAAEILVPSVPSCRHRFQVCGKFRRLWKGDTVDVHSFATAMAIPEQEIKSALRFKTFGAAMEALRLDERVPRRGQPLQSAVEELQAEFPLATGAFAGDRSDTSLSDGWRRTAIAAD